MNDDSERTVIAPRANARLGTKLNGIYEIESLIAVGGMGEVYKGRAMQTGDAVAIKMIRPDMARDEAVLALFRREAAALHNLYNEAIVRYYVFAIDPVSEAPYLAMEFVDGQPLSERIRDQPLTVEEADVLRRRVAPGLHAAHRLGIIHRDISPDNIILPGGDPARAKIIDFGIARSSILGEGTVIGSGFAGKYNYVSPEQLGLSGGDVTGRSDMYAFALVLAEAVAGRAIDMGGSQVQIVDKRRRLPDLSQVDARLRPLLAKMLSPDPAGRPADMAEVASWQLPPPTKATILRSPIANGAADAKRRSPLTAIAAILGLAVLGVGGFYGWTMLSSQRLDPTRETGGGAPALTEQAAPDRTKTDATPSPTETTPEQASRSEPDKAPDRAANDQSAQPGQATDTKPAPVTQTPPTIRDRQDVPPQSLQPEQRGQEQRRPGQETAQQQVAINTDKGETQPSQTQSSNRPAENHNVVIDPGPTKIPLSQEAPPVVVSMGPEPRTPAERIERFVRTYNGGSCFSLWPLEIGDRKAVLEGFGRGTEPFVDFDSAFKTAQGFEAQISLRSLTAAQCPVADFMRRPGVAIDRSPKLQIGSFNMKSGEVLSGTVEAGGGQNLDVILVGDDGLVYNLASYMKRDGGKVGFNLKLESTGGPARPQTVLALVSREALPALSGPNPSPASEFFANLKLDLARQGGPLGLAVKYFRIE